MDGYLSNKPKNFVGDPEKLYRLMRREAQAKQLEFADPKAEAKGSSESPKESPPPSPTENQLPPLPMVEQPQPERKIGELCTPDIVDLPILNLAEIGRLFEIKTSTICMVQHSPSPVKRIRTFTSKRSFNFVRIQHGRGDSRSNEGKTLSILVTWEGLVLTLLSLTTKVSLTVTTPGMLEAFASVSTMCTPLVTGLGNIFW
jgi:hypothetical protein